MKFNLLRNFLCFLLLIITIGASAQTVTLASWEISGLTGGTNNFGPSPLAATTTSNGLTTTGITRGTGIATSGTGAGSAWGGTDVQGTSASNAISINDFFTIPFTTCATVSFTQIPAYNIRKSGTGATSLLWQYSINSGSFIDIGSAITIGATTTATGNSQTAISLSGISALQNLAPGTNVTFRMVLWGGTAAGGTVYINNQTGNDMSFTGTISNSPTTSSSAASSVTNTTATLNGSITPNTWAIAGGSFEYGTTVSYGTNAASTPATVAAGSSSNTSISANITGLTPNTLYNFRSSCTWQPTCTGAASTFTGSNQTFTTLPNAPTVGTPNNATIDGFTANWTAPSPVGNQTYTYEIQASTNNTTFTPLAANPTGIASSNLSFNVTGLSSSTTYYFRVRAVNSAGNSAWSSASTAITTLAPATPTLGIGTVSAFGNQCVNTSSSTASATITGTTLNAGNITVNSVSPVSGFEFSSDAGSNWSSSLSMNQSGGSYSQNILIRFSPTAATAYSGNVTIAGGGASSVTLAVSGTGINGTVAVSTVSASSIGTTSASSGGNTVSTSCGTVTAKGVVWGASANPTIPSVNSTNNGTGTSTYTSSISGLSPATTYNYRAYATNSNGVTSYGSNLTFTTLSSLPTAHAASFTAVNPTSSTITLNFSAASAIPNAAGYIILQRSGSAPADLPVNATAYTAGNLIGTTSTVAAIITNTSATSTVISGLSGNTNYFFQLIPFGYDGSNAATYNYRTTATIPSANATTLISVSIWTNPITGTNPNTSNPYTTGDLPNANVTVSGIGRGTSIVGTSANDRYNSNTWNVSSLTNNYFFTFTITPAAGFKMNMDNLNYTGQTSGTGPANFALRSSADSYAANISSFSQTTNTTVSQNINLGQSNLQGLTSAVTFRLYAWGASAAGGTFSVNDFNFTGSVVPDATTWTGANGTSTWTDAGNWSNGVPTTNSQVTINNTTPAPILSSAVSVVSMTMQNNATLTINANLTVTGNWTGNSSTVDGTGTVILSNGIANSTLSGTNWFNNLQINDNVTISTGSTNMQNINNSLTIGTGFTLTSNGNVTLHSDATGTAYLNTFSTGNTGTYSGTITIERYSPGVAGFRFLSPSVNNASFNIWGSVTGGPDGAYFQPDPTCQYMATGSPYASLMQYNEANITSCRFQGWQMKTAGTLTNGRGYSYNAASANPTFSYSGTPNNGTITSYTLTNAAPSSVLSNGNPVKGTHMLGNPYPSPISWTSLRTSNTQLAAACYLYNGGSWVTYMSGGSDLIASGQAFQVVYTGGTNTVTFSNSHRIASSTATFYNTPDFTHMLNISVQGNNKQDQTVVYFDYQAHDEIDLNEDAYKMQNDAGFITLYTGINGNPTRLSYNGMPLPTAEKTIPMGMIPAGNGTYTLNVQQIESLPTGMLVYLKDLATGTVQLLNQNPVYTFTMTETESNDRFELMFTAPVNISTQNADCTNPGSVQIETGGTVWNYSVNGTSGVVSNTPVNLNTGDYTLVLTEPQSGYIVTQNILITGPQVVNASMQLTSEYATVNEVLYFSNTGTSDATAEWNFGDGSVATGNSVSHSYTSAGSYQVVLTINGTDGCTASATGYVKVGSTSVENAQTNDIRIYPNPASDFIQIVAQGDISGKVLIEIISLDGRKIRESKQMISELLNISDIPAGTYVLKISAGNIKLTKRLIRL